MIRIDATTILENWDRTAELYSKLSSRGQGFIGRHKTGAEEAQLVEGSAAVLRFQRFDRVRHERDMAAAFEQALRGKPHAILRDDSENEVVSLFRKAVHDFIGERVIEDVERLLFDHDLLVREKVFRQFESALIRHSEVLVRKSLGNDLRAGCSTNAMRRKRRKLGVVWRVLARVGDEQDASLTRRIDQPLQIRNRLFRAGDV